MKLPNLESFDFDEWKELAANDPEVFESRRRQAVEALIGRLNGDKGERLRALQWRIDQVRRLSPAPISACYRMYTMMWDAVLGDGGLLEAMRRLPEAYADEGPSQPARRRAEVLPFERRRALRH